MRLSSKTLLDKNNNSQNISKQAKDDNYYSYIVDRRSISYNRQSLKKETVRLTEIKLGVDLKIYDGTILDGVLIDSDSSIISSKSDNTKHKMQFRVVERLV